MSNDFTFFITWLYNQNPSDCDNVLVVEEIASQGTRLKLGKILLDFNLLPFGKKSKINKSYVRHRLYNGEAISESLKEASQPLLLFCLRLDVACNQRVTSPA